jgi:hypothetical protein
VESEKFDELVRGAFADATRRGVVRVGIGALAASAIASLGLTSDDAEAKKKKKKKKKKTTTTTPPPPRCQGTTPVTCGDGCCPSQYPLCCAGANPTGGTCNPSGATCCPLESGGGACGGPFPKCCPATQGFPFGSCARTSSNCCPPESNLDWCGTEFSKCCKEDCCFPDEPCCGPGGSCPAGRTCLSDEEGGCCVLVALQAERRASRHNREGSERLGIPAQ